MREKKKRNTVFGIIDLIVFAAATCAIAGIAYEGLTRTWYPAVTILIVITDYTFLPATVIHLFTDRKEKKAIVHVFSMIIIIAALIMKAAGIDYPAAARLLWHFYVWFLYGAICAGTFFDRGNKAK